MYQLRKTFKFEASHQLIHHEGKCSRLHGHSYLLTVELSGERLQKGGSVESHLDHHHLNETLETDSPTAEFIAKWIYDRIYPQLPLLEAVMIQETASCLAVYRPKKPCCTCRCHEGNVSILQNGEVANGDIERIDTSAWNGATDCNGFAKDVIKHSANLCKDGENDITT